MPPDDREYWDHEAASTIDCSVDWLWHGLVASGNVTLLTSMWKAGKTTLLSLLLARRKLALPGAVPAALAGLAVKPGKTIVVTEESPALWAERARRLDFGGQVIFISRPFAGRPSPEQWQALIDRLLQRRQEHGIDLAVFDPLAPLLRRENQAGDMFDALRPLATLTRAGMAVLLLHHPAKGDRPLGHAARGSGALLSHVDISVEMRHLGSDLFTRRRRFISLSRFAATPRQLILELDADGLDYLPVADAGDGAEMEAFRAGWQVLQLVLEDAPQKLTRRDILCEWPEDFVKPGSTLLWKWLDRAVADKLIAVEGSGRRNDPFRYWLPAREEVWKQDIIYMIDEQNRLAMNMPFQSLHGEKVDWMPDFKFPPVKGPEKQAAASVDGTVRESSP